MSYIEENGYFIFGDVKSSDYGVWISGGGTFNAPARRYKEYVVPGRNGTLTIDEGAYEEAEVTYPAFIARDFPANVEAFRNAIMAQNGYVRMTDSYHPDEYYLARYMAGLEVDTLPAGRGGSFELTFKRDPRRFLVSGEEPITLGVPIDIQTVSGSIVSIDADADTKITGVVADINPVQDLHGYDHPWAGGNGKNLIPYPYYQDTSTQSGVTFTVNTDGTIGVKGTATATVVFFLRSRASGNFGLVGGETYILSGCPSSGSASTYKLDLLEAEGGQAAIASDFGSGRTFTYDATRTPGAMRIVVYSGVTLDVVFKPMIRLASETDDTWQPYANICPITGHTSVEVTRAGRNLIPYPYYEHTHTENGITWTDNGDGTITANGTATATSYFSCWQRSWGKFPNIVAGQRYVLSLEVQNGTCSVYFSHTVGATNKGEFAVRNVSDRYAEIEFTAWEDEYDGNNLGLYISKSNGQQVNTIIKPMLRLASETDATYEKYTAQKYTTTLGRTVYGGTLDVVSGLLTVDKAFVTLTGASGENWSAATQSDFVGFYLNNTATVLSGRKASGDIAVNEFVRVQGSGWSAITAPGQILYISNINLRVNNAVVGSTVEELRTWLANNPIEIAYELATPQTYQLTPQEVITLLGTNNIWADTGDVSVEYGTVLSSVENPTLFDSKPLIRATFDTANENYVKMPYSDGSPYESNGITYTTEADGSIRVVGTCGSTRSYFSCRAYNDPAHLPPGNYHFEGCPAGGSSNKYYLTLWFRYNGAQVGTSRWDYGTGGLDFTITETESQYDAMIQIYVQPGTTIDELFTPTLVADTDEVYFYVGSDKITLQNRFAYIDIDSDIQDCYSGYSNANPYVKFQSNDFPVLEPGATGITLGAGLESIAITPRWFRL